MRGWILSLAATASFIVLTGCAGTDFLDVETFSAFVEDNSIVRKSSTTNSAFQIYTGTSSPFHLRYSRGGDMLAFAMGTSIVVMLGNGANATEIPGYKAVDFNTDGTRLYAVTNANTIVSMDLDGSNVSAPIFTGVGTGISSIDVNHDGGKILISYAPTGVSQLFVMDSDGTNATPITGVGSIATDGRWSFDSMRIVYTKTIAGNADVYAIDPDGTDDTGLATTAVQERTPSFQTDGRILYSQGTGNAEIYQMEGDGSA
ncbi:MAG: hypothetical protein KF812_12825, partial [Fimbriimonadaceae bacterium]|nr:hypothetical protein [Fimbriimonadaceae bacterium]